MQVVTRFAPSPTGFLHIGGARTALFNWLFARHHAGKFLLRIEDTDRARSTQMAVDAILDGLSWLGLEWDEEPIYQFSRIERHAAIAHQLLSEGKAYQCYCSPDELDSMRSQQKASGQPMRYDGRWRDRPASEAPSGIKPVIRLKAPRDGETVILDKVRGEVKVANSQLDDMILLRSDGTPTYMLAVVVDDHDMGVTHVIRGEDHLTNCFRQIQIYRACGWNIPIFCHVPLIHGSDGTKLSKRHGALGAEEYRAMGFLPEALRNYLLRLGWGHGDDEIISTEQAVELFDFDGIGASPSRFDLAKLTNLNGHYLRQADDSRLVSLIAPEIEKNLATILSSEDRSLLQSAMPGLKQRAKTLIDLTNSALFLVRKRPIVPDDMAKKILNGPSKEILQGFRQSIAALPNWEQNELEDEARNFAGSLGIKLGELAQPLRAAITGTTISPPIFDVMHILGKDECLGRISDLT